MIVTSHFYIRWSRIHRKIYRSNWSWPKKDCYMLTVSSPFSRWKASNKSSERFSNVLIRSRRIRLMWYSIFWRSKCLKFDEISVSRVRFTRCSKASSILQWVILGKLCDSSSQVHLNVWYNFLLKAKPCWLMLLSFDSHTFHTFTSACENVFLFFSYLKKKEKNT
jgi:hypothetical protein